MNVRNNMMNDSNNKMKDIKKILYNQVPLQILSFLSNYQGTLFSANEIANKTKSSKGSTNQILRFLSNLDILFREKKGNLFLYRLNAENFVLKQFKIFENLLELQKLVKNIKEYCYKIVIYGSRANGTDNWESDIDLFIITEYKKEVRKIISKYETIARKVQAVLQDPLEVSSSKKEDSIFYQQVGKGITLWEGKPTYEG